MRQNHASDPGSNIVSPSPLQPHCKEADAFYYVTMRSRCKSQLQACVPAPSLKDSGVMAQDSIDGRTPPD